MADVPTWRRVLLRIGEAMTGLGAAWVVTWGALVASATRSHPHAFWILASYFAIAAVVVGIVFMVVAEADKRLNRDRESLDNLGPGDGRGSADGTGFGDGGGAWPTERPAPLTDPVSQFEERLKRSNEEMLQKHQLSTGISGGPPSFSSELDRFRKIDRDYDGSDGMKAEAERWITDVHEKLKGWNQRQGERFITDSASAMTKISFAVGRSMDDRQDVLRDPILSRLHIHYDRLMQILDVDR